jgi:hypothetical protein
MGAVYALVWESRKLTRMPHDTAEKNLGRLATLFPGLTEEQYVALDAWYTRYAALIFRMYERITSDPEAYARFLALTSRPPRPTMTGKVDSPKQTNES